MRAVIAAVSAGLVSAASICHAQASGKADPPSAIVVYDFAGDESNPDSTTLADIRKFPLRFLKTYVIKMRSSSAEDIALFETLEAGISGNAQARTNARKAVDGRERSKSARVFALRGDVVRVYVFHRSDSAAVTSKQTLRESRIDQDIVALGKVVAKIRTAGADAPPADTSLKLHLENVTLEDERAIVTIAAAPRMTQQVRSERTSSPVTCGPVVGSVQVVVCVVQDKSTAGAAASTAPAGAKTEETPAKAATEATVTLTTGTGEHLFLSANAGAADVIQSEYDAGTQSLVPTNPKSFFIGANFALTDLSTKPKHYLAGIWHDLYFGGLVQADTRPFDQVALIGGWRRNFLPLLRNFISFDVVSPYGGMVWVKSDTLVRGEKRRRFQKPVFIWGASLNLSKATEWLSPRKEESERKTPPDPTK